jgi:hypothetical protein
MDPQMVYAEVKKTGFKTRICDYERVTQGEAGIRFWKVTGTKTKVFRKWLRRSYVPTSQLTDVDAEDAGKSIDYGSSRTMFPLARGATSQLTDEAKEERRRNNKKRATTSQRKKDRESKKKSYVPTSQLTDEAKEERRRLQNLKNKKHQNKKRKTASA